jgi:hypothetical protein
VIGLEWVSAQVIGDWTPAPTVVCVSECRALGYAREGLPLCDGDRNAVARAPPMGETNGGAWPEARAVLKGEVVNCCYRRLSGGREGVGIVWWIADIPALFTAAGLTDTSHSNGRTSRLLARFTYRPWACTPACVLIVAGSAFWGLAHQSVPHLALGHRDSWARPAVSQPVGRLPQLDMHFLVYAILSLPWDAFHAVPEIECLVVSTSRSSTHNGHAATS